MQKRAAHLIGMHSPFLFSDAIRLPEGGVASLG